MGLDKEIYKIFVTTTDLKSAGSNLSQLAEGEIGLFDLDTNLTVEEAGIKNQGRYFFATKLGGKIVKSPNRWLSTNLVTSVAQKPYVAPQNKKVTFTDFKVMCGKDYTITVLVENEMTKFLQGTNSETVLLTASSKPCTDCTATPCNEEEQLHIIKQFLGNTQAKYVTVKYLVKETKGSFTADTEITKTNVDEMIKYNTGKPANDQIKAKIVFEAKPLDKDSYKEGYFKVRNTDFTVVVKDGFVGNGTLTENTKNVVEQGLGFDLNHLEWRQQYNGYRQSNYDFDVEIPVYAKPTEQYETISIVYGNTEQVGPFQYNHPSELIIAVKGASTKIKKVIKKLAENGKATIVGTL